jgi:hypothetical protein
MRIGDIIDVPPVRTVIKQEKGKERSESITGSFVFPRKWGRTSRYYRRRWGAIPAGVIFSMAIFRAQW